MKYKETGSVLHQKDAGRFGTSQENVEHVRDSLMSPESLRSRNGQRVAREKLNQYNNNCVMIT